MFIHKSEKNLGAKYNLRRLFVFRSFVIFCELVLVQLAMRVVDIDLPIAPMLMVLAVYALFNVYVWFRLKSNAPTPMLEIFFHIVVDVFALTALLYFSGGSSNPFVSLFLLPLVIVAASMPKRYVWSMAFVTLACYSLLMVINVPLTQDMGGHMHHQNMQPTAMGSNFGLHVLGMWFSFLLGVSVILFFVVSMAEALRQRDQKLAEANEKKLRDQHVVILGTLAAGAAHELGTPLGTMAILTKEMENEYSHDKELLDKVQLLRSQVDRCKTTISQISVSAGQPRAESGSQENIRTYILDLIQQWKDINPSILLSAAFASEEDAPNMMIDETLKQAFFSLFNNALEAHATEINIDLSWQDETLALSIIDNGEGFSPAALQALGSPFFTTKPEGHGLGFYLAQAVFSRLGGTIHALNHAGGARINIQIPLTALVVH